MDLAQTIDHTLLRADATEDQIVQLCDEARQHRFFSVCVNPYWVTYCANYLADSGVTVCTVVGFPLGATTPAAKQYEAAEAVAAGAGEVDMVLNIGALRSGLLSDVEADIRGCAQAAHNSGARLKVILETALLSDAQKEVACRLAVAAGTDFVKTSTGFASGGATTADVQLLRRAVGPKIGVKASGGIRDYATAQAMLEAGANRLGTSSGVGILTGAPANGNSY